MLSIGDKIRIISMAGEPRYSGRTGTVTEIGRDCCGDTYVRGTWGGCSVYESAGDVVEKITEEDVN